MADVSDPVRTTAETKAKPGNKYQYQTRYIEPAKPGDEDLGPLKLLPGVWKSKQQGWNMIALPFDTNTRSNFRVLMNQYRETLKFTLVDKGVPNRGIATGCGDTVDTDQFLVTLDYEQVIHQIRVDDEPMSSESIRGKECAVDDEDGQCLAIHHEPGLWLNMTNQRTDGIDIARMATIPHGNSVLALGRSEHLSGKPEIPELNALPIGAPGNGDLEFGYLAPYKRYEDKPFTGTAEGVPGFPGFFPTDMNAILRFALDADPTPVLKTTILHVDTTVQQAGIVNIPFIEKQADASEMKSTFWIQELDAKDEHGRQKLRLQYSQVVFLDFFPRVDGVPGLIRWPHVSINTLDKVVDAPVS